LWNSAVKTWRPAVIVLQEERVPAGHAAVGEQHAVGVVRVELGACSDGVRAALDGDRYRLRHLGAVGVVDVCTSRRLALAGDSRGSVCC
jgi:hypothetical protein